MEACGGGAPREAGEAGADEADRGALVHARDDESQPRRRAGVGVGQLYASTPAAPAAARPQALPPASQSPKTAQVA